MYFWVSCLNSSALIFAWDDLDENVFLVWNKPGMHSGNVFTDAVTGNVYVVTPTHGDEDTLLLLAYQIHLHGYGDFIPRYYKFKR